VSVRSATAGDVSALLPLLRGYCDFYEASPPDRGLVEMARSLIEAPDSEGILLVAEGEGGRVSGFAAVCWKWSSLRAARVAVMEDLFVSPEARGAGLGDALIRASARRAAELGAPHLEWLTAPDNRRAQATYDRTGAKSQPFLLYQLELMDGS
jgi:GNAT superfamily N-acetyltransferase